MVCYYSIIQYLLYVCPEYDPLDRGVLKAPFKWKRHSFFLSSFFLISFLCPTTVLFALVFGRPWRLLFFFLLQAVLRFRDPKVAAARSKHNPWKREHIIVIIIDGHSIRGCGGQDVIG